MIEHNCRNLGGYGNTNPIKIGDNWVMNIIDDYYNFRIKYCPYCGKKL